MTRRVLLLAILSLWLAALACDSAGPGPDTLATVNALNSYVHQTLTAQAIRQASASPTPPAATPRPNATQTVAPSPTELPKPTAPPTATTPSPAASALPTSSASEPARPNGPVYHAAYSQAAPVMDGNLDEWKLPYSIDTVVYKPENWQGINDNSVSFGLTWNATCLYVGAQVIDDVHVQTQHGALIFKGDSLEILLDADLASDYNNPHLDADDFQLGLSPGALNGDTPEAFLWYPSARAGAAASVQVAAQPDGQGYRLEAAIPWALFDALPAGGRHYGFVLSASDNDTPDTAEQQSMISTVSSRKFLDPTTWGTLALDSP